MAEASLIEELFSSEQHFRVGVEIFHQAQYNSDHLDQSLV